MRFTLTHLARVTCATVATALLVAACGKQRAPSVRPSPLRRPGT